MPNWVLNWSRTHPCDDGEGFSNCFLRYQNRGGADCTVINTQSCGSDITNDIDLNTPEVFYVLYNIYAINNFFTSWWLATQLAAARASFKIDAIVNLLDPPQTTGLVVQDILTALLAGLAFIPAPIDIILAESLNIATHVALASVMTALVVAPGVCRGLFPAKTNDTRSVEISQLNSELADLDNEISARLAPALATAQNDLTSFTQLASTGAFSAHPPLALDQQTTGLDQAFTTFILTTCLANTNWIGAVALDTSPQQLATNGTKIQYDLDCQAYDANGVCNAWWYDSTDNAAFTLDSMSERSDNPYNRIHTILSSGWSTGDQLFSGAYDCNKAGNYGRGVIVNFDNGKLNTDCISQLKMCTFEKQCTFPGTCQEFSDCDNQNGFGFVPGAVKKGYFTVPSGYLGPLLTQTSPRVSNV
ncbi:MAG: hypothetical protein M1838_005141 [Thelocarpon superellum]|nr:MAG: hypothetical protein M1838_005141 [Thelocarpon superellum]